MKQKTIRKAIIVSLVIFSLGSFVFVNADINRVAERNTGPKTQTEAQVNTGEENARKLPVPAVNLMARLAKLAQRIMVQ